MTWKNDQITEQDTLKILELAKSALQIEGDFVEFGCYKGDTSLLLAELLAEKSPENHVENPVDSSAQNHVQNHAKKLWIYDSFEGLPTKSPEDESILGVNFKPGKLQVTKREVKARFLRANLPVPIIKKAWFSELTSTDLPGQIAFALLDGDFYQSIRTSLQLITPRMNKNGIVIVHDYTNPALPGVKQAVDEWIGNKAKPVKQAVDEWTNNKHNLILL